MRHKLPQLFLIFSAVFFLLSLWYSRYRRLKIVPPEVPREVSFSAVLKEEPYIVGRSQYFELNQIRIRAQSFPRFHYGDTLKITGILTPELEMGFPKIEKSKMPPTRYVGFIKRLYRFRNFLDRPIIQSLPEPQASLLSGILLGIKRGTTSGFSQKLRDTGTIHVVVVSGYNITVLGGVLVSLTRFLGRRNSLLWSLAGIFLFALMVGAEPPVIR
ncbi:ComEC/Rec2 family competence protein, partial [Candidatus Parcubacteria bacterium]|nr:ComEC/Rec2 family competence protein [Candidatus Parcubacteria bacterium]